MSTKISMAVLLACASSMAHAQEFDVVGGQTSVLLDTDTLASAASLTLSGVSSDVIAPGELGDMSVAFGINARDASMLPTSFSYDAGLSNFAGSMEHTGSVFFNSDSVEVGNFTIGYDAMRVGGDRSGFFVQSTTGISAILFDVAAPSFLSADAGGLIIEADLLVSSEFAGFLLDNQFATADLTGADVGDARVNAAAVPAPGALAIFGLGGLAASRRRR
ncbi:MAG: PEP-CTERM sorting domain-containing protein [Phycisphaerales bacterium]